MGCDKKWGGRQILISDPNREIPIVEWFEGERESDTEVREAFNGGRGGLTVPRLPDSHVASV